MRVMKWARGRLATGKFTFDRTFCVALAISVCAACGGSGGGNATSGANAQSVNPVTTAETMSQSEAARFLIQAGFGPSQTTIKALRQSSYGAWIKGQMNLPATTYLDPLLTLENRGVELTNSAPSDLFWDAGTIADDELRQRMVLALSEILVISMQDPELKKRPLAVAYYMDLLSEHAFGNYRDLLEDVTYSPAMSEYLTYMQNKPADMSSGSVPDENFAREILQLFTIGLVELRPNGEPKNDSPATYDNDDVEELARVFTGLSLNDGSFGTPNKAHAYYQPLRMYEGKHDRGRKDFLGLTIPSGTNGKISIKMTLDHLVDHPNMAPFISRQLIQRFITSNPSPQYVARVAAAFEAGSFVSAQGDVFGDGRKGDLAATIAAILLDTEARRAPTANTTSYGKVREPMIRFWNWARAFNVDVADAQQILVMSDTSQLTRLNQHPFGSPSVFNFFRPGYVAPGTVTGEEGLHAPELQIASETSHVGYINFISQFIWEKPLYSGDAPRTAFLPDYSQEISMARRPDDLVDHLSILLVGRELEADNRTRILNVLEEIRIDTKDTNGDRRARVHTAIFMIMTSPEFLVQR